MNQKKITTTIFSATGGIGQPSSQIDLDDFDGEDGEQHFDINEEDEA